MEGNEEKIIIRTKEQCEILGFMYENEEMFEDMEFNIDSITGKYLEVEDVYEETEDELEPPEILSDFSYDWFDIRVEPLADGSVGRFNPRKHSVTIDPDHTDDEPLILHMMIHMHEDILDTLPAIYHEDCLLALIRSLEDEVDDMDDILDGSGNLLTVMFGNGDFHDTLFILKSYDLDIQMGWELGTVLSCGANMEYDSDEDEYEDDSDEDDDFDEGD